MATLEQMERWKQIQGLTPTEHVQSGGAPPQAPQAPGAPPVDDGWSSLVERAPELLGQQDQAQTPDPETTEPGKVPVGAKAARVLGGLFGGDSYDAARWDDRFERMRQRPIAQAKAAQQEQGRQQKLAAGERNAEMAKRIRDPESPESKRAQELLRHMGLGEQADGVTAEQFSTMFPGYQQILQGARQSQQIQAKTEADLRKREMDLADKQDQREWQQEYYDWQQPYRERTARASARGRVEGYEKLRLLGDKIGDENRHATETSNYASDLRQSGVPRARSVLDRIEGKIQQRIDRDGEIFSTHDMTVLKGPRAGWGLMSDGAKDIMQLVSQLQNIELKDRSGAAVTNSEFARYLAEVGIGLFQGEADFMRGIQNMRAGLEADESNIMAGYEQEVVDNYNRRIRGQQPAEPQQEQDREPQQKTVERKQYSPSRDQTRIMYSDGTSEIVEGKQ